MSSAHPRPRICSPTSRATTQRLHFSRRCCTWPTTPPPAATVMAEVMTNLKPIGSHTAHICEATDILFADPPMQPVDGESGDTNYPYGSIKVLATVGEYLPSTGCTPHPHLCALPRSWRERPAPFYGNPQKAYPIPWRPLRLRRHACWSARRHGRDAQGRLDGAYRLPVGVVRADAV